MLFIVLTCAVTSNAQAFTVGVILTRNNPLFEKMHEHFTAELNSRAEGKDITLIVQRPYADPIAWTNTAKKFVVAEVDVIVAYGTPATLAALNLKSDIPVIFAGVYSPALESIKSGRASGLCSKMPLSSFVRYIKATAQSDKIAVLYSGVEADSALQTAEIMDLAARAGFQAEAVNLSRASETTQTLSAVDAGYYVVTSSAILSTTYGSILRIANNKKVPIASLLYGQDARATITLTTDPEEHGVDAAKRTLKVKSGFKPNTIETSCSDKVELIFNMREATKLGINIPMELVTGATRIIN